MSTPTPPLQPKGDPSLPSAHGRSTLAKLAIGFAVTIGVTFGLCSISLMHSPNAISGNTVPIAAVIEAVCVLGLIIVGITAIIRRANSSRSRHQDYQ